MDTKIRTPRAGLAGAVLALACGAMVSLPATAAKVWRSFYQNTGSICRGIDSTNDAKLTRTANRLINDTDDEVTVICNLMTDAYADYDANYGVVAYVGIWARTASGAEKSMSCDMTDGFFNQGGVAATHTPSGGNPQILGAGGGQTLFEWIPDTNTLFLSPVNVWCKIPARSELNDALTDHSYSDVGARAETGLTRSVPAGDASDLIRQIRQRKESATIDPVLVAAEMDRLMDAERALPTVELIKLQALQSALQALQGKTPPGEPENLDLRCTGSRCLVTGGFANETRAEVWAHALLLAGVSDLPRTARIVLIPSGKGRTNLRLYLY